MTAVQGAILADRAPWRSTVAGTARMSAVPLWTVACFVVWALAGIGWGGEARRRAIARRWAGGLCRILRLRIEALGPAPETPFLLVANHLSYLDIVVLASLVDATFVAKREVRQWPLFGPLARAAGCIFVDRETPRDAHRAASAIGSAVKTGRGVVLFAEGTSSDGSQVLPLRPALLEWAAAERFPVHSAALSYHTVPGEPPPGESLCWWGNMTFLPHLAGVCRLRTASATVAFVDQPLVAADRRSLAAALHTAILSRFTPSGHAECAR
ncbi:MAG TPA: lysophospholipid acyltransferase family protein [Gemmatimonadales bacterium]|jgi:1-acyl-sn-glycerol-3-phosphate acyltransferase